MGRQIEEEQVERVVGLPPCLVRRRHTELSSIINLLGYKMSSPSSWPSVTLPSELVLLVRLCVCAPHACVFAFGHGKHKDSDWLGFFDGS